ncbi:hypothetical protein [Rhodopila sp.]|uniref:hypothetical protein n=1 Tax=Rhodopila sp. TaxID=2480087 RepID=UPI003D129FB1
MEQTETELLRCCTCRRLEWTARQIEGTFDMLSKSPSLIVAAVLVTAPMLSAMAQQNNPTGNMGSNSSATATPMTKNNSPGAGSMAKGTAGENGTKARNRVAPGATGKTVVPGSKSSQASAADATKQQKSGSPTTGGGK